MFHPEFVSRLLVPTNHAEKRLDSLVNRSVDEVMAEAESRLEGSTYVEAMNSMYEWEEQIKGLFSKIEKVDYNESEKFCALVLELLQTIDLARERWLVDSHKLLLAELVGAGLPQKQYFLSLASVNEDLRLLEQSVMIQDMRRVFGKMVLAHTLVNLVYKYFSTLGARSLKNNQLVLQAYRALEACPTEAHLDNIISDLSLTLGRDAALPDYSIAEIAYFVDDLQTTVQKSFQNTLAKVLR